MNLNIHILTVRSYSRNKQTTKGEIYVKSCEMLKYNLVTPSLHPIKLPLSLFLPLTISLSLSLC